MSQTKTDTASDTGLMRVPSERISRLMDLVAELSLSVAETVRSPDLDGLELSHFETAVHRLMMIVHEVQDTATEMRLVPVDDVFKRLRRMVREIERQTGKKIDLVIHGADTQIDKLVADRLYDPLLHVLRNSADHGLELPAERIAAGKPELGRITLSAAQVGSEVRIVVEDDGRGLNRTKILAKARERGFFGPDEEPEPAILWKVIFKDGFSTAENVSNLSGRGVGMDVLNTTMNQTSRAYRGGQPPQAKAPAWRCISRYRLPFWIALSCACRACYLPCRSTWSRKSCSPKTGNWRASRPKAVQRSATGAAEPSPCAA